MSAPLNTTSGPLGVTVQQHVVMAKKNDIDLVSQHLLFHVLGCLLLQNAAKIEIVKQCLLTGLLGLNAQNPVETVTK